MSLFMRIFLALAFLGPAAALQAAPLSKADLDKALAILDQAKAGEIECLKDYKTAIDHRVEQIDLNKDGTNELVVTSGPADRPGVTIAAQMVCFGQLPHIDVLIADGQGGWQRSLGTPIHSLDYHPRSDSAWPDIETAGPGFCFPIYRYQDGRYRLFLGCDRDNRHVRVDASTDELDASRAMLFLPMIGLRTTVEFDHNGSLMVADPARGEIAYKRPKRSIARLVAPGTVVFRGQPWDPGERGTRLNGMAYVFKKGCDPANYWVQGQVTAAGGMVLEGAAPVRRRGGCAVIGFDWASSNARLDFVPSATSAEPAYYEPARYWAGDYSASCGRGGAMACTLAIEAEGDSLTVRLDVTRALSTDKPTCQLTGKLERSANGYRGTLAGGFPIQLRQDKTSDIILAGLPKAACGVKVDGRYSPFGDI